eukprot:m.14096 g.14096  ORF g.14096 m.14096 type:complete len:114 (+) comp8799_c0_seq1:110-451(+)
MADEEENVHAFDHNEIHLIVKEVVDSTLGVHQYQASKVEEWGATIVDKSLKELQKLDKPFKFIVNTTILQRTGGGMHTTHASYWDSSTDGSVTYKFDSNKTMICVTSAFGIRM